MDSSRVDAAEAAIRRGERARVFLGEGIFQEAWAELDARLMETWRTSPASAAAEREEAYRTLRAMAGLRNILEAYVQDGQLTQAAIDQIARESAIAGQ